jgi:elongation factor 3
MDEPAIALKRSAARIIEHMVKLVDDPYAVEPFAERAPKLARAKEEVADPECRKVCEAAHTQLTDTAAAPPVWKCIEASVVLKETARALVSAKLDEPQLAFVGGLAHSLLNLKCVEPAGWAGTLGPRVASEGLGKAEAEGAVAALLETVKGLVKVEEAKAEEDDAEQLCDCQFSLAYGNKVLLNQATLKLKRGYRYGLCGKNDSGKTSLMRAIASQQVDGFPPPSELRTMFVETDVQGELSEYTVLDFVAEHAGLQEYGVTREMAREMLLSVGFATDDSTMAPASLTKQVGRLSGGWRMKVALCRAMLMKADILLLDEPTNHLDPGNVKWVLDYLTSLKDVTSIIVSHDIKVLDQVCTHVTQIDKLKLRTFKGNLTEVATQHVPELLTYFELKATKFHMSFPTPGMLEGVNSRGKHIMKMTNITFTYPGAPRAQLTGVTVRISLGTRAACIGANGAGKSTMIKLLTGELQPDEKSGEVWKHPNARVAYVAQHAFVHIEHHLQKTPNEYIRWRYEGGADREGIEKVTMKLTAEEEAKMKEPIVLEHKDPESGKISLSKAMFKRFTDGRRTIPKQKKDLEYEVEWQSGVKSYVARAKLEKCGFSKLLKQADERIAARATQMVRPLTQKFVESHLGDVGLEPEFATHSRIGALSGGQKVKVVLAAAMWNTPHIVILDEPTNYLDRDSLGAMAEAINGYAGGVVIISHNAQFVDQVCPEVWHLENHTLNLKGSYDWLESANKEAAKCAKEEDTYVDGQGNEVKIEKAKKPATKQELKKLQKLIKEKRKAGQEVFTDDELEEAGFLVEY